MGVMRAGNPGFADALNTACRRPTLEGVGF